MTRLQILPACAMVFAIYAVVAGLLNARYRRTGRPSLAVMRVMAVCGALVLVTGLSLVVISR